MGDLILIEGFFTKTIPTENGEIISLGINLDKFKKFINENPQYQTEGGYLNVTIAKSKTKGTWYSSLNTCGLDLSQKKEEPKEEEFSDELLGEEEIPF